MKTRSQLFVVAILFSLISFGQENTETFKPSGSPFVKIFANYHSNFENTSTMELKRTYIGYGYNLSKEFSIKANIDVTEDSGKYIAYLKLAQLQYKKGKTKIKLGLISTTQFKTQEKFWGYRYIYKTFQDKYKFNASADLGASIDYKLIKNLSIDFIVQNGEGYKHVESTETYRGGLGVTYLPIKSLTLRIYSDVSSKPDVNRISVAGFIGYKFKKKLTIAAEYNIQSGNKFKENHDYTGISAYATYIINNKFNLFARYDMLQSNTLENETSPWNVNKNGAGPIAGIEYVPIKGVKISTNYRGWHSDVKDTDFESMVYLNFVYSFK